MRKRLPLDDYEPVLNARRRSAVQKGEEEEAWAPRPRTVAETAPVMAAAAEAFPSPVIPVVPTNPASSKKALPREHWIFRKGHGLTYICLFAFTVVLYFRPYELIPALASFTSIAFWLAVATLAVFFPTQLGLEGNLTERPREVNLVLLLICAGILSIPFAYDRNLAFESFTGNFLKASLMFIVMVNVVRTRARWNGLVFLNLAVCCLVSLWAIIDFTQGRGKVEGYRVEGRIEGVFKNPNELALNLVIVIPIVLGLLLASRGMLRKVLYGALALLMVGGTFVTYSRGGFLGLAAAGSFFIWKLRRTHKTLAMAFVILGLAMLVVMVPGGYLRRMMSIFDHSKDAVGSASSRWDILLLSLKVAARNPLFGIGMRNFEIVSIRGLVTHNAYTQVATEMGIAAMVVFIMFLVSPFRRLKQIEEETAGVTAQKWFYFLALGIQASFVGFMVSIFFGSVAYQWYTYYLVGYAVCLRRIYQSLKPPESKVEITNPAPA